MKRPNANETASWVRGPKKANVENVPLRKVGGIPGPSRITKKVIVNIPVDPYKAM